MLELEILCQDEKGKQFFKLTTLDTEYILGIQDHNMGTLLFMQHPFLPMITNLTYEFLYSTLYVTDEIPINYSLN